MMTAMESGLIEPQPDYQAAYEPEMIEDADLERLCEERFGKVAGYYAAPLPGDQLHKDPENPHHAFAGVALPYRQHCAPHANWKVWVTGYDAYRALLSSGVSPTVRLHWESVIIEYDDQLIFRTKDGLLEGVQRRSLQAPTMKM